MKVCKGDEISKRPVTVNGWNPWTRQRTISIKLKSVVCLHTLFCKAWRSPAEKHNHCSVCEAPRRTAAIYSLSLQEIGAYALSWRTIGYPLSDLDLCVG